MAKAATRTTAKKAPARKAAASKSVSAKAGGPAGATAKRLTKAAAPKGAKKSTGTSAGAILTLRHIAEQLSTAHELPKR